MRNTCLGAIPNPRAALKIIGKVTPKLPASELAAIIPQISGYLKDATDIRLLEVCQGPFSIRLRVEKMGIRGLFLVLFWFSENPNEISGDETAAVMPLGLRLDSRAR
jgi:hypothetical protein